jgi:copper chaperone CopZ
MSGRWEEQNTPFTCIIDLFEGIENLNNLGFSLVDIPGELSTLNQVEQRLIALSEKIEQAMENLDTNTIQIASEILDGSGTNLSEYKDQMEVLSSHASAELESLTRLFEDYKTEEARFENCLKELNQVDSVNINTPNGMKNLELIHGRYRYRHYNDDYGNGEELSWLNSLSSSYSDVGEKRRKQLKNSLTSTSRQINKVQISLQNRVTSVKEASAKAANEELRRSRDKEVMNIAKKGGFRVTRKQVGKKVQYALVRQR